jgi:SAM-dependent methyltransferase
MEEPPPSSRDILEWVEPRPEPQAYVETHLTRLEKTLAMIPPGGYEDRILEMGAYLQMTPALNRKLGYGQVRGCYHGPLGGVDHKVVTSENGDVFECDVDLFDAEKDIFPYPDAHFSTVLCCELIEHLAADPMHMMAEINRILKPGGHLVLTTPNLASLRSISGLLQGYHPGLFSVYLKPSAAGVEGVRHHREYTPIEIHLLLKDSGFDVVRLETGPFRAAPHPGLAWVTHLLKRYQLPADLRGEGIYAVGSKMGPVRERYPAWLYSGSEE